MKFRKKPVVIEAMQYRGTAVGGGELDYWTKFDDWLVQNQGDRKCRYVGADLIIPTLEGDHTARPGDMIIKGVQGELYPCKLDIFEQTYGRAED